MTDISGYNTTNSIQLLYDVRLFNEKLGILKDGTNFYVLDSSENYINEIDINIINFKNVYDVISVGYFSNLYIEFTNAVKNYFIGFKSIYNLTENFNINNNIFDNSVLYNLITGNLGSNLLGDISFNSITDNLRFSKNTNCFNNRDISNGTISIDGANNGFFANDILFIPQGISIILNIPIEGSYKTNRKYNIPIINNTQTEQYHITTTFTPNLINMTVSAPLLIKFEDFSPSLEIYTSDISYNIDYENLNLTLNWNNIQSNNNFIIIIGNNGFYKSNKLYNNILSFQTNDLIIDYSFYITPFLNTGIGGVGYSKTVEIFTPIILNASTQTSGSSIEITWSGLYITSTISLTTIENVIYTYTRTDSSYNVIYNNSFIVFDLDPYIEYEFIITPYGDDVSRNNIPFSVFGTSGSGPRSISLSGVDYYVLACMGACSVAASADFSGNVQCVGAFDTGDSCIFTGEVDCVGAVSLGANSYFYGIIRCQSAVTIAANTLIPYSTFNGDIYALGDVTTGANSIINGNINACLSYGGTGTVSGQILQGNDSLDFIIPDSNTINNIIITAYNSIFDYTQTQDLATNIINNTLLPGFYKNDGAYAFPAGNTIQLIGEPNDTWIIQVSGALSFGSDIIMSDGVSAANIQWGSSGAISIAAGCKVVGIMITNAAVSMGASAEIIGGMYSSNGACTIGASAILQGTA